jgi:hypothetical protein
MDISRTIEFVAVEEKRETRSLQVRTMSPPTKR